MNCLRCGHNNNATVPYCAKCGCKLDLTADEIGDALIQKAADERASNTEFYARQMLFFSIIVFMVAITLVVLAGGAQTESYAVPSIVNGTRYTEIEFRIKDSLDIPKALAPFSWKR